MTLVVARLELRGPGGEPVDLWRTLRSHGVADLPPMRIDDASRSATVTLPAPDGPRTLRISEAAGAGARAFAAAELVDGGPPPGPAATAALAAIVRRMLCLDDDLSGFYAACASDPELAWTARGAGRLLRSPTVFEDIIKTICTTNCTWSATERMVGALVDHLGAAAPVPAGGTPGRAFPTPETMAGADPAFYRDVARAGYRTAYLRSIAASVASGESDLEALLASPPEGPSDDDVERRLLELPGVGPYAAAHVMMLLGRHSRLVFDSWTRPKYARLQGRAPGKLVADRTIMRRFRRYGRHAGLAFWLVLTRDWVDDEAGM